MRELEDWERQCFINELSKTQKFFNENADYFCAAINYFSMTIANIIGWQTQLEDTIDRAIIIGEASIPKLSGKLANALKDIRRHKYCNNGNRNNILAALAKDGLSIANFSISPFEKASRKRNAIGHMSFRMVNDKNNVPLLVIQSREEGNIDIEKFSVEYIQYFNDAQDMLDYIFQRFDIPSIYWKTIIKQNSI